MTEGPTPSGEIPDPQPINEPAESATPPVVGEPPKSGMSGCAKAAIIGAVVVVVVIVGLIAFAVFGLRRFVGDIEGVLDETPCEYIGSDDASDVIGTRVDALSGDSAVASVLGLIRDTRLLGDAPSCYISSEDSSIQVWISVHDGGDAAEVFASGAEVADGQVVSETNTDSGTITVETDPFRGADVPGLGEEAFCVDVGPAASGGVFARSGDRVVYVTALALAENEGAEVFDGTLCERSVPIAEALLD